MVDAAKKYKKWAEENPKSKLAADLTPGVGVVTSVGDAAAAADEGKYGDAALELLGVVPGAKLVPLISKLSRKASRVNKTKEVASTADKTSDTLQYAEGRKPVEDKPDWATGGMKKGGKISSASTRADGCAQRGKTKGRMV
jgi:hypothetical protein